MFKVGRLSDSTANTCSSCIELQSADSRLLVVLGGKVMTSTGQSCAVRIEVVEIKCGTSLQTVRSIMQMLSDWNGGKAGQTVNNVQ